MRKLKLKSVICRRCGTKHKAKRVDSYCESCKEYNLTQYNKRYKQYAKGWKLMKRYGITPDEYDEMAKAQEYRCKICGQKTRKNLCVDHDHSTNDIRGLLCKPCNLVLGNAKDDINILQNAINYLKGGI